jgi:hypothetical protein
MTVVGCTRGVEAGMILVMNGSKKPQSLLIKHSVQSIRIVSCVHVIIVGTQGHK